MGTHTASTDRVTRQLDTWRELFDGCTPIADLIPRQHETTLGVIQRLRYVPGESMEVVVGDGTGKMRVVWTGPDVLTGLELGRGLRLEGTVCIQDGAPLMRNPTWCLVKDPYACNSDHAPTTGRRHS